MNCIPETLIMTKGHSIRRTMIEQAYLDYMVMLSSFIFYAMLCLVYLLRAYERPRAELALAPVFSLLLIPFSALEILNLVNRSDQYRLIVLVPIIIYLIYDLWYRLLTRKKPVHHPKKWPTGLIIYLVLLQAGCIGVNWYGYLVSKMHGMALVVSYFIMLGFFGFYQGKHNKRLKSAQQQ